MALLLIGFLGAFVIWLASIRPYAVKHRAGFTPGANVGITAWVDWEQARSIARARGDAGMVTMCRLFFCFQGLVVLGFVMLIFW